MIKMKDYKFPEFEEIKHNTEDYLTESQSSQSHIPAFSGNGDGAL